MERRSSSTERRVPSLRTRRRDLPSHGDGRNPSQLDRHLLLRSPHRSARRHPSLLPFHLAQPSTCLLGADSHPQAFHPHLRTHRRIHPHLCRYRWSLLNGFADPPSPPSTPRRRKVLASARRKPCDGRASTSGRAGSDGRLLFCQRDQHPDGGVVQAEVLLDEGRQVRRLTTFLSPLFA